MNVDPKVGQVSASRRPRWTYRRRMEAALQLLAGTSELDALVAEEISFLDATRELPNVLADDAAGLAPVIAYATR